MFSFASSTGFVTVNRPLDYEELGPSYIHEFVAIAIDNGDPQLTSTATVRITVTNINDHAPQFTQVIIHCYQHKRSCTQFTQVIIQLST